MGLFSGMQIDEKSIMIVAAQCGPSGALLSTVAVLLPCGCCGTESSDAGGKYTGISSLQGKCKQNTTFVECTNLYISSSDSPILRPGGGVNTTKITRSSYEGI